MKSISILTANLRNLRLRHGFTQEMVAEKAGVTHRHYQDIEAGRRPGLQLLTIDKLAAALNETTSHLLEPNRYPKPEAKRGRNPYRIKR